MPPGAGFARGHLRSHSSGPGTPGGLQARRSEPSPPVLCSAVSAWSGHVAPHCLSLSLRVREHSTLSLDIYSSGLTLCVLHLVLEEQGLVNIPGRK